MAYRKISAREIEGNVFKMIGDDWMLITGGDEKSFNTMTAGWGGMGILWGKPVAFSYVRPQRYTKEFMDSGDYHTLSFYSEQYKNALSICGAKSGRDTDKVKEAGLTPAFADCGAVYFDEADLVLVCRKLYYDDLKPENFLVPEISKTYKEKDYHRLYIGEIIEVLKKD